MSNPLLTMPETPNHAPAFDQIKEEHFLPALKTAIETARQNVHAIRDNNDDPDFENTIVALETASDDLSTVTSVFYNQLSAAGTDGLQELAEKIGPISSNFSNDVAHDTALFARVKAVYDKKDELSLTPEQDTLLENTYIGFVRSGALLNQEDKQKLRKISEQLSVLGPDFADNVKKSTEAFELVIDDKGDLTGLPESAIDSAHYAAEEKGYEGKWLFTLDVPSYLPFMQFADKRDLREKLWKAYGSRAWQNDFDNSDNIKKILDLRQKSAKLLGYATHAHYVLERRMAEHPDKVMEFLDTMKAAYKDGAEKDLDRLKAYAKKHDNLEDLKPWDVAYYGEKIKQELFDFSSEDLRPYFPLDQVLDGTFTHFTKLFGLKFVENKNYPVWHKDVKAYDVLDNETGDFIGTLYGDFFPRKGKKGGAWKTAYRSQGLFNGKNERPVIAIVCNFTKPTDDKPSLLTHDEVTTLFHEMGHAVHALVSDVTYPSVSGTNVKWDFVELPSQVQENWAYTKETLDLFARHYKTGEKIPAELVEKLNKAKTYMASWGGLRQMSLASIDMAWHLANPDDIDDVAAFEDEAVKDTRLFPRLAGPSSTSFSHIFAGGYSAGYYSYKWAEVLDADAFEAFLETSLYDQELAQKYKTEILAKGGSEHPSILYKRFRGRDAAPEALLRREGLLEDNRKRKASAA